MNDYFDYWAGHSDKFLEALGGHFALVGAVIAISLVLCAVIVLLIMNNKRAQRGVLSVCEAIYSIPSLALFSILTPFTGLGFGTAVLVMVLYNQFLLVRNVTEGLNDVDHSVVEAAEGMGMSPWQVLCKIKLPLAMPMIVAGIRLALISTIGIATIAATINAGGLGTILFTGLRTMNEYQIVGGVLLCALVALVADIVLRSIEFVIKKKAA